MVRTVPFFIFILALVFFLPSMAFCETGRFSLGAGFDFATGDYGTEEVTDSYTASLSLFWYPSSRLDFELTVPYLYQSNSTSVMVGGRRFPFQEEGSTQGGPGGPGRMPVERSFETTESQRGLGDMTLSAGYSFVLESDRRPLVRALLYSKFPTADEEKGLGTGEFDIGGGLGLGKWVGNWSGYLEGMVIVPGSSETFDSEEYWTFLASLRRLVSDRLVAGVSLSHATAAFEGAEDVLEVSGDVTWWASERFSIGGYLTKGLTEASADFGGGLSGTVSF